jgi:uncharacterized protein YecA (UPF0149 family)
MRTIINKLLLWLCKPIDIFIDIANLRRKGYHKVKGKWTIDEMQFVSREYALEHMHKVLINQAALEALRSVQLSSKARNMKCPCGSGQKYKKCCYIGH